MKIKAKSSNKPTPAAAQAFARLLAAVQEKRPDLNVVEKKAA